MFYKCTNFFVIQQEKSIFVENYNTMKRICTILSLLLLVGCNSGKVEQSAADVYNLTGSITVNKQCDLEWILRYEQNDIKALVERAATEPSDCDVMFFGSSSIRLWKSLQQDMAPLVVVNRGYGGATYRDLHYNYKTVMAHYNPKAFVIYCDNDLRTKPS